MLFQEERFSDEIEELRELLYDIIKDFPTGITSTFLEQQFVKRYVQAGLASALPANWLNLLSFAEEFQIRHVSTYTILSLANANIPQKQWETAGNLDESGNANNATSNHYDSGSANNNVVASSQEAEHSNDHNGNTNAKSGQHSNLKEEAENMRKEEAEELPATPIAKFHMSQVEAMQLESLPSQGPVEISIIAALDPENIFFRLKTWDPYCDYLYSALSRLPPMPSSNGQEYMELGQVFGAKIDGKWERVELVRRSTSNPYFWIVDVLDAGTFTAVHEQALRPLTEAVTAFKKIFLAVCKLDGIQTRSGHRWPPETQHYISEALQPGMLDGKRVELVPTSEWHLHGQRRIPACTGKLLVDGAEFGEQLVQMGLAQRK